MIKFDLEKALAGAEVRNRLGQKVRLICYDRKSKQNYSIVALVDNGSGIEDVCTYNIKGQSHNYYECDGDLMLVGTKKRAWVVLYHSAQDDKDISSAVFYKRELAMDMVEQLCGRAICVKEIEYEE